MATKPLPLNAELLQYIVQHSVQDTAILQKLREKTAGMPGACMQIPPEQGQFLYFLVGLLQPQNILEFGTYTGYSTLVMAMALPEGGHITTLDRSEEAPNIAKQYWAEAGVANKITFKFAEALDSMACLPEDSFDLIFIDADKKNQIAYYERSLKLLKVGGVILVDNVLWGGAVIDKTDHSEQTTAIRELNTLIHSDQRVTAAILPLGDGLTLIHKR